MYIQFKNVFKLVTVFRINYKKRIILSMSVSDVLSWKVIQTIKRWSINFCFLYSTVIVHIQWILKSDGLCLRFYFQRSHTLDNHWGGDHPIIQTWDHLIFRQDPFSLTIYLCVTLITSSHAGAWKPRVCLC